MDAYRTLLKQANAEYVVQKSRFIGHAAPAACVEDALALLDKIKKEHSGASHNCFAYIIGANKGVIRYGDDGEPSGTAGKPIAEVLLTKDIVDCAVVVTRYFGGILLGAGGLVRAYAHATSLALDAACVCTMHETGRWGLRIAYPLWDRVSYAMQALPMLAERTEYAEDVRVSMLCRICDETSVLSELMKATDGKIEAMKEEKTFFHPWGK